MVLSRLKTFPVSLRLICEIHGHLMEGVRGEHQTPGEFRRSPELDCPTRGGA